MAFEKITIEEGLSQGMIFDILQTRDGFLWVATKDGLNRYDGYNFKVYSNDPFNPYSIAEDMVTALYEDSRGWLWIGTLSRGVDLFDPHTGRFHHFPMNFQKVISGAGATVNKIQETADGAIWVLKFGVGLIRITIPDAWKDGLPEEPLLENLTQLAPAPINIQATESDWLHGFFVLRDGNLLVTTIRRMFVLDVKTGHYKSTHEGLASCEFRGVALGNQERDGDLWAGDMKQVARIRHGQPTVFKLPTGTDIQYFSLHNGINGHVWYVVNNLVWDLAPGEDLDFSKPDLVLDVYPNCIRTDKNGNLWFGTVGYGLRKFNPAKSLFHAGAKGASLMGLWRSPAGKYFCKTRISHTSIFLYDTLSGKIAKQSAFPDAPLQQISMAFESDGTTWLLCTSPEMNTRGMLRRYTPAGQFVQAYLLDIKINLTDQLLRSSQGLLWVANSNGQLLRFDPRTGRFDTFSFAHLFAEQANAVHSTALTEDGQGHLWIGTQLGLVKCVPDGPSVGFELIKAAGNKPGGLNNNSIACLLADPADPTDILWIGTKGGGINRYDQRSGQFLYLTTASGMPNNVVYGILPGNKNEFWCSTNRGLAKITINNETKPSNGMAFKITSYTAAMGLQDNEFNSSAYFKTAQGELLFGGINGLNRFFPEQLRMDTFPPPVYIVGLEVNHQKAGVERLGISLANPIERLRELRLKYDQNNLSFEFAALDFTDPSQNRYRYQLVGLDKEWVETRHHRFAHFNHLAPGTYEFRVQASNGESRWTDAANPITIVIMPPWWRSKLACLGYVLLMVWLGWRAYLFQIRRLKEREQLAFELRETERIKALEQMKTDFFSNVTHELRTPLSLILEPARQLLKNPNDPSLTAKIRLIEKHGRQLHGLVNQLLDMAKLEAGHMPLELRRGDFGAAVRDIFEVFLPLAEQHGIRLTFRQPKSGLKEIDFDPGKIELILNNLLSNALKFTPTGGNVEITIAIEKQEAAQPLLKVAVSDTGIGIPPDALGKVFDRFYQVDGSSTRIGEGTGIGLALGKELAHSMGGDLSVHSTLGVGSTFTLLVPLVNTANTMPWTPSPPEVAPYEVFDALAAPNAPASPGAPTSVVLLIEDNVDLRQFLAHSISGAWQVVEASNGEEGEKKALDLLPDLIISDVMLPKKDGFAVVEFLKNNALTAHIPIILLTAKADMQSRLKGLRRGADDYLSKPFSTEELLARMDNLVTLRRRLRAVPPQQPLATFGASPTATPIDGAAATLSEPDRDFLQRFNLLIERHLADERIGVEDLAAQMAISRMQLHRKLTALTDQSATAYVRNYRLERAMQLLKNREGNVSEVSARVGFGSGKYFSTAFKEKFGISPSQV